MPSSKSGGGIFVSKKMKERRIRPVYEDGKKGNWHPVSDMNWEHVEDVLPKETEDGKKIISFEKDECEGHRVYPAAWQTDESHQAGRL